MQRRSYSRRRNEPDFIVGGADMPLPLLFIGLGYFNIEGFWVNLFIITGSIFIIIGSYKLVKSSKIIPRILYVLIISIILF